MIQIYLTPIDSCMLFCYYVTDNVNDNKTHPLKPVYGISKPSSIHSRLCTLAQLSNLALRYTRFRHTRLMHLCRN